MSKEGQHESHTPLHCFCKEGDERGVRKLLRSDLHAEDLNARDLLGRTPLHLACKVGRGTTIVRWLLKAGAEVDAREQKNNVTPLHVACRAGCSDTVRLLRRPGPG